MKYVHGAMGIAALTVAAGQVSAQLDEGDIGLSIVDNRIVTSLLAEEEEPSPRGIQFIEQRVFIGELGKVEFEPAEPGDPSSGGSDVFQDVLPGVSSFSTNTPGFDSGPGVFDASASVGFSILNGLQVYDPQSGRLISAGLAEANPMLGGTGTRGGSVTETLAVEFNAIAFQTDSAPGVTLPRSLATPLDGLPVFSNGRFHRHWNFTILPVDNPASPSPNPLADPGVYVAELVMTTTQSGIADSLPLYILFPFGVSEMSAEFADAVAFVQSLVEPGAAGGCNLADLSPVGAPDNVLNVNDIVEFVNAFNAGCP